MTGLLERHARSICLAVILLTLGGLLAARSMPISLFPHIDYPRIVVTIDAGDRDAAQMAAEISRPAEIALRSVSGVTRIRSTTSRGTAEIALNFGWGQDMVSATLATQGALATLQPDLPAGTRFEVRRSDPTIFPVLGVALTSRTLDQQALRQIAELKVRPALTAVQGVAAVDILGGAPHELAVDIDPARLQAYGIGISDVSAALARSNTIRGAGRLEDRHRLYLVLVQSQPASAADLLATPIRATAGNGAAVVTLRQVATVRPAAQPEYVRISSNGRSAVLVNVRQALSGDTVAIVAAVDARLKMLGLPVTVAVTPFYDQSELVTGAADAVRDAILLGALLAGLILFLFLRSGRLMLITGLMLPAVLAGTCLLLYAFGLSFDMMTLGGMAAAVGLIVDDAVVMLEHMMRRMQEGTAPDVQGRLAAAAEMGRPLVGSTLATMIVFLPLSFISGVSGGFFKALAITIVTALGLSLLYSRLVIPLLAARWLRDRDREAAEQAGGFMAWIDHVHARIGDRVFARPGLAAAIMALLFGAVGILSWYQLPSGFMPAMDEGGFVLDFKARPGAALADTDRLVLQVEGIISATPEVASYSRRLGAQLGGGLTEADEGDFFIRLKNGPRRPIDAVMSDIRQRIEARVPGLQVELIQLMEDLIGDLTAVPQPIEVKLFGDDPAALGEAASRVGKALGEVQGVVEIVDGLRVAGDAVAVRVDSGLAAQQGLDPDMVADQVEALVGGNVATSLRMGDQLVGVRVRGSEGKRQRVDQIASLSIMTPDGRPVRLGSIARVEIAGGQQQITREDLSSLVAVTARLEGRDLGSAMQDVKSVVAALHLPASIRIDYGGLYAEQQKSFADMTIVFVTALLLSALLLTFLFENVAWTLSAIAAVLLVVGGALFGLWLTGTELNVSALMGLTMVVGMVTELVVFFLAEIDRSKKTSLAEFRDAASKRLRPILMSAFIAMLTLAPLALGLSRGAGLQQPLAIAIIFGLMAAMPIIMLFMPAALHLVQDKPD
ncbi:efflux RND transporter permease subunit [Sphingobium sp. CFD-1]|uniref:efflux RND transporter permease subunit n=1 Tax=Sphingobium sp. CFD-1 TaxID=2878545 RepID=UPI00214C30FB|nr:efflux RND transporter permease subunit [Sphingobium sp. CFD-1]